MSDSNPLPADLTGKIIDLSKHIPDAKKRQHFLAAVTSRIAAMGASYPNTILYGVAGMLLGEILDNLLTVPLIGSELTSDLLSHVGALLGAAKGYRDDVASRQVRDEIASIIRDELRVAVQ